MKLAKTLHMLSVVTALLGSSVPASFALPNNEVEIEYFSDATFTNDVGYEFRSCNGGVARQGKRTRYRVVSSSPCHTSGPMEMACYFDYRLTTCPLNVCDTDLVTCISPTVP